MFGFGSWNRNTSGRNAGVGGILGGGGFRRAAMMGLGMMAYRWWRNRNAGAPAGAAGRGTTGNW
jgi:hypothetical protein